MALQIDNAACVLGTESDRDSFEELFLHIACFFKPQISLRPKKILPVDWDSGWYE